MADIVKTMKLHIHTEETDALKALTKKYMEACNHISDYIFEHHFILNAHTLHKKLYQEIRSTYGLKSQFAISVIRTVTAKYKTIQTQMKQNPYCYEDKNEKKQYIKRTLEWLQRPVQFKRPQADLVRNRDYSFVTDKKTGETYLSLNTLGNRIRVSFDVPACFKVYFDGTWSFGTGKIVSLKGEWYFHIPMTQHREEEEASIKHIVGIDRGLRFLATTYDENEKSIFINGKSVMKKRDQFQKVRSELQAKHTKSAKRALKRISGRENRWMSDINHQISKTLVERFGKGTLFVLEDLKGVSFSKDNLSGRPKKQHQKLRTWAFYQLEQFLTYKSEETGSKTIKVDPKYTSQRCPKCGRIHKANRHHEKHEYVCDKCGYRSNDDRVAAMNLHFLGQRYLSGEENPSFAI